MDDYFANSKYKIKDADFSDEDMSDESDGMLFPHNTELESDEDNPFVKFFDSLPK